MSIARIKELVNLELRIQLTNKEVSDYIKEYNNFQMELSKRQRLIISDYNQFNQFALYVMVKHKQKTNKSVWSKILSIFKRRIT